MSHVQMAADTLQIEFLFVFLVIEMGRNTLLAQAGGEQLLMTLLAGLVVDDRHGMFQLLFALPVDLAAVLGHVGPQVFHARFGFGPKMGERSLGRQMAFGAAGHHAALAVVVHRELPALVRLGMDVARLARLVGRTMDINPVETDGHAYPHGHGGHYDQNDFFTSYFYLSLVFRAICRHIPTNLNLTNRTHSPAYGQTYEKYHVKAKIYAELFSGTHPKDGSGHLFVLSAIALGRQSRSRSSPRPDMIKTTTWKKRQTPDIAMHDNAAIRQKAFPGSNDQAPAVRPVSANYP